MPTYTERKHEIEFLLLQRAKNKIYAGQWRMVGVRLNGKKSMLKRHYRKSMKKYN